MVVFLAIVICVTACLLATCVTDQASRQCWHLEVAVCPPPPACRLGHCELTCVHGSSSMRACELRIHFMLIYLLQLGASTTPGYMGVGFILSRWCLCCSRSVPQPIDSHWSNNPVRMRLPPGGVPASYPQMKLPVLDNPALFEKLDTEALFFAFYYMPGTHQQYLAARELKRQSWRYHKQHGAWFQVHFAPAFNLKTLVA